MKLGQEICQVYCKVIFKRKKRKLIEIPHFIPFFLEITAGPDHLQCWQLQASVNVFKAAFIQTTGNNF